MNGRFTLSALIMILGSLAAWFALAPSDGESNGLTVEEADSIASSPDEAPGPDDLVNVTKRTAGLRESGAEPEAQVLAASADLDDAGETKSATVLGQVPAGTAVVGRLLDGAGAPVREARLKVVQGEVTRSESLQTDAEGRFAVAVDLPGNVVLFASADGVGRSLDLAVFLPEGQATDVGALRLVGAGTIRGHVRFPDGGPFPGINVHGEAVDPLATPGLRAGDAETESDGSFEIAALAPGPFEFRVSKDEFLPVVGSNVIQTGNEDAVLVVDAALLRVSCVNEAGETVPMKGLELSNVVNEEPGEDDGIGSTSRMWGTGVDSFDLVVRPGRTYMIQAHDAQFTSYFAYLEGNLTAGVHELQLRTNPPNLGALKMSVLPGSLDERGSLSLGRIRRNGHDVMGTIFAWQGAPGGAILEMRGLVPGAYEVTASVKDSEWIALKTPQHNFELAAGETEEILLQTREGGRLELFVQHEGASVNSKTRAEVHLRRGGELEWAWAKLTSKRGSGSTFGSKVWIDGTRALSGVLQPGSYQLRLEAEGYMTSEVDLVVRPRASTSLRVTLLEE